MPTQCSRRSASTFATIPEALAMWRDAGADVDGERVRFPAGLCRSLIQAQRPAEFTQHARNPASAASHRRRPHGAGAGLRFAVRPRPGRRTALRHPRGLPEFREADLHVARAASLRRHACASRWIYRSTSATSTWSTATSATATSPSWAR